MQTVEEHVHVSISTMTGIANPQRHSRSFERRPVDMLHRHRTADSSSESGSDDANEPSDDDEQGGLFSSQIEGPDVFMVEHIWAKRFINTHMFYFVMWEDYPTPPWKPRAHIPWQFRAAFEREHRDSAWDYVSTRGRTRPARRIAPVRISPRLQGADSFGV